VERVVCLPVVKKDRFSGYPKTFPDSQFYILAGAPKLWREFNESRSPAACVSECQSRYLPANRLFLPVFTRDLWAGLYSGPDPGDAQLAGVSFTSDEPSAA
jgi:hypothetical protein